MDLTNLEQLRRKLSRKELTYEEFFTVCCKTDRTLMDSGGVYERTEVERVLSVAAFLCDEGSYTDILNSIYASYREESFYHWYNMRNELQESIGLHNVGWLLDFYEKAPGKAAKRLILEAFYDRFFVD